MNSWKYNTAPQYNLTQYTNTKKRDFGQRLLPSQFRPPPHYHSAEPSCSSTGCLLHH